MITILNIDISDKKNKDEFKESFNFISIICSIKLSDNQIEELLDGKLKMSLDEFILFFKVYSVWYNMSIIKIWTRQDDNEYLYIFQNKEYLVTP